MKVLYVEFVNDGAQICGVDQPASSRVERVVLTPEQGKHVEAREIAYIGGTQHYETVRPICIQDEPEARP